MKEINHDITAIDRATPKVSIGLPVFNGENYIEEALDSILNQTYSDFELIISDNVSKDNTQQICEAYAAKDSRIRYYRNKDQLGATNNHIKVFRLSRGELFKWAAHDDVLAPNFLFRCVNLLEKDPSVVLCHTKTACIDEKSRLIGTYDYSTKINSKKPHERLDALLRDRHNSWVLIFGVIRAEILRNTPLFGNYIEADRTLLAELCLMGRICQIPKYLFFRRSHPQAFTETMYKSEYSNARTTRETINWWSRAHTLNFPTIKSFIEYFRAIRRVPLKSYERQLCYLKVIDWFLREGLLRTVYETGTNLLGGSKYGLIFQDLMFSMAKHLRTVSGKKG